MTVVAILGTLAAVYVFDAFGASRDSARITSLNQIVTNMDLFKVDTGFYPDPDNSVSITLSWSELWKQWEFGSTVSQKLWVYGSAYPQDPRYEINYNYSVTNNNSEYQIGAILEDLPDDLDEEIVSLIIPQANAAVTTAYVDGNYNGFLARAIIWSDHHFVITPSIIASDLTDTDIINIIDNESLVFDEFFNLPSVYNGSVDTYWWFAFFPEHPIVFSWALVWLQNRDTLTDFINEIKFAYSSSQIATFPIYQDFIEWDTYTSMKKILERVFWVPFSAHSCNDILANWEWLADGFYVVDSDEWEDGSVYCDMTTGQWWWTRVWVDYLTNWEFQWWVKIESERGSNATNQIIDLGTDNTPVVSEFVVHQTWASRSEYQVHFDDSDDHATLWDLLQPGHELRMTLWLRDDDSWATWFGCNTWPCNHNPWPWYVFHNRLYYLDGTNEVNGTVELLDTQVTADGKTWNKYRVRKTIRKQVTGFHWYIGYWAELNTDLYFTGVQLEVFYK